MSVVREPYKRFTGTVLNDDELREVFILLEEYFQNNEFITNKLLRKTIAITYDQAIYFFKIATREGRLVRVGSGSGTKYVLP